MSLKESHKVWRKNFREGVFERDDYRCKVCGSKSETLDAHHITDRHEMPNGGYVLSNGISLCPSCHLKAERYHITNGRWYLAGYHPNDLYKLIDSSYEIAITNSKELGRF